jgi:hypothetical protein
MTRPPQWAPTRRIFTNTLVETSRSAFDSLNSVGVNTRSNDFDTRHGHFSPISRQLNKIRIRRLSEAVYLQNAEYNQTLYHLWIEFGESSIGFNAVLDPRIISVP